MEETGSDLLDRVKPARLQLFRYLLDLCCGDAFEVGFLTAVIKPKLLIKARSKGAHHGNRRLIQCHYGRGPTWQQRQLPDRLNASWSKRKRQNDREGQLFVITAKDVTTDGGLVLSGRGNNGEKNTEIVIWKSLKYLRSFESPAMASSYESLAMSSFCNSQKLTNPNSIKKKKKNLFFINQFHNSAKSNMWITNDLFSEFACAN